jgi:hypothetical protein
MFQRIKIQVVVVNYSGRLRGRPRRGWGRVPAPCSSRTCRWSTGPETLQDIFCCCQTFANNSPLEYVVKTLFPMQAEVANVTFYFIPVAEHHDKKLWHKCMYIHMLYLVLNTKKFWVRKQCPVLCNSMII